MMDFQKFTSRHGEFGAQAIVERLERYEGIRHRFGSTLEERWNILMHDQPNVQRKAA